jgi:hypothetical protein
MLDPWIAHVLAELVGTKLKVRTSPCSEVLKRANAFLILAEKRNIRHRGAIRLKEKFASVHGISAWIAVQHVEAFEKVQSERFL